jgi:cAMP phosphodiesterase
MQMDVFGHFTPLFMADTLGILPSMQFSSDIMLSGTF